MEASIAALSEAADSRPTVAVADPPSEAERRRSASHPEKQTRPLALQSATAVRNLIRLR